MQALTRARLEDGLTSTLLGLWAAAVVLEPDPQKKLMIAAPAVLGAVVWWTIAGAGRWLSVFLLCAILLPPIQAPFGNAGVHPAPLLALIGIFAGILRMNEWRAWRGSLPFAFCLFLAVLTASTGFAAFYFGWAIALGSLARVVLFGLGVYVFLYAFTGPRSAAADPLRLARWLFLAGAAGALFACLDFYFQWPAPAGYGAQFIWVGQDVLRRAQGLFYEASTLGNFCAFFLVMILTAFFRPADERPCSRLVLAAGGVLFAGALIFSYSRASLLAVAAAGCAFAYVRRLRIQKALWGSAVALTAAALLARFALPTFAEHYWIRLQQSFTFLLASPNAVLSGRVSSWSTIVEFLLRQPWHAVFGIGYKTLPYTDLVGEGVVADNTYLSLLVETGIVGLAAFIALNFAILRTALRAARSTRPRAAFFGSWIFCFWCGQVVQMLSGDLITYWRVLPLYFWVLAIAARETALP